MASLLLEIGCEELPAGACREAERQLPAIAERELGAAPDQVFVGPRRLALLFDEIPERTAVIVPPEEVRGRRVLIPLEPGDLRVDCPEHEPRRVAA